MSKLKRWNEIANRPNTSDIGAALSIDHNKSLRIELHACAIQANVFGIRSAPNSHEHLVVGLG